MNIASVLATKGGRVFTIGPGETIREALRVLAEKNVGALVVVDPSSRPVGILSERDIVRQAVRNESFFGQTVGEIMTRDLIVGQPQDDLATAGYTMSERRIRHLPIVDQGTLVGIVSIGDIVKAQRDRYAGEIDTLQVQLFREGA